VRIANHAARARIVSARHIDDMIERANFATLSNSGFGPSPTNALELWESFRRRAQTFDIASDSPDIARRPVDTDPSSTQELAVETNCADHASKVDQAATRAIIAKLRARIVGHQPTVESPTAPFDWEVELGSVIERPRVRIGPPQVGEFLAGFVGGQDLSERESYLADLLPQFAPAKSRPGFGPTGPWLTTTVSWWTPTTWRLSASATVSSTRAVAAHR